MAMVLPAKLAMPSIPERFNQINDALGFEITLPTATIGAFLALPITA